MYVDYQNTPCECTLKGSPNQGEEQDGLIRDAKGREFQSVKCCLKDEDCKEKGL